jgi:hypothetical protein
LIQLLLFCHQVGKYLAHQQDSTVYRFLGGFC